MWVTTRVSPSTTRSSSSRRPPRSSLAPLASSALNIAQGAAGADQPLHLKVQILVLGLSHRDPGIAVHRHLTTPLAGIPEVWLSASGVATGFASHPLSYDRGEFTAGGWKQGCFQPGPPDSATMRQALRCHVGEVHRRAAGPAHPPRPYPGDERRQLPPPPQPAERRLPGLGRAGRLLTQSGPADPCS